MALQHTRQSAWAQWDDITALEQQSYWRGMGVHVEDSSYEVVPWAAIRSSVEVRLSEFSDLGYEPVRSPEERIRRLRAQKRHLERKRAAREASRRQARIVKMRATVWRTKVDTAPGGAALLAISHDPRNTWLEHQWTQTQQRWLRAEKRRLEDNEAMARKRAAAILDEPAGLQLVVKMGAPSRAAETRALVGPIHLPVEPPTTTTFQDPPEPRPRWQWPRPTCAASYAPAETETWKGRQRRVLRPTAPDYVGLTLEQAVATLSRERRGLPPPDFYAGYDDCK